MKLFKQKIGAWIRRYLVAELLSFITTLLFGSIAYKLSGDKVVTALAATWGGNISYFGYILIRDIAVTRKRYQSIGVRYTRKDFFKNIKALFVEFGVAELLDSFVVRPALMYYFPIWLGDLSLGIFLAKLAADITFYIPAIVGYELSKRYR